MKYLKLLLSLLLLTAAIHCSNSATAPKDEPASPTDPTAEKKEIKGAATNENSSGGLTGSWKLYLDAFDDNGNGIMEKEEREKGVPNNYRLQLNADGSSRMMNMFTGRYEVTREKDKDVLKVYRKKVEGEEDTDPPPEIFHIISIKPDELILQVIMAGEPSSFWVFKRE